MTRDSSDCDHKILKSAQRRVTSSLKLLQEKDFIYRGLQFEKLSSFSERMLEQFPSATIASFSTTAEPDDDEGLLIRICGVNTMCNDELPPDLLVGSSLVLPSGRTPRTIHRETKVSRFQHDRPFRRGEKFGDNEFKVCLVGGLIT